MGNNNEVKKTIRVKWVCDKNKCKQTNIRIIGKYHVIFEDTCDKCNKYIHEPITKILKEY
jgi:hypothetical protein